jgi:hypothetical protein
MQKLVSRTVEAAVELRTHGGEVFPTGTKFTVHGVSCGKLQLDCSDGRFIRQVHPRKVNLIPQKEGWGNDAALDAAKGDG